MSRTATGSTCDIRPLKVEDAEAVIAIDSIYSGHARRSFFEKRFAAARLHPDEFVQIGATREGALQGFAMARILRGEFGRMHSAAVLDGLAVAPASHGRGVGRALMTELAQTLRRLGVRSLHSQAVWANHDLLRFFASSGFELAPRLALERAVTEPLDETLEDV